MRRIQKMILPLMLLLIFGAVVFSNRGTINLYAQSLISATPARVTLPQLTDAPAADDPLFITDTPTRTPTPEQGAYLEAINEGTNVRADADPEAQVLGTIRPGDLYRIRGRYFRWIQFEYPNTPGGLGWVFDEIVVITGDQSQIADLSVSPTVDPNLLGATPTVVGTSVSGDSLLQPISELENSGNTVGSALDITAVILPTYTYPPNVVAQAPTAGPSVTPTQSISILPELSVSNGVAPIVPIVVLGVSGMLGLVFSLMRRR
jgi:hypothetical protein